METTDCTSYYPNVRHVDAVLREYRCANCGATRPAHRSEDRYPPARPAFLERRVAAADIHAGER